MTASRHHSALPATSMRPSPVAGRLPCLPGPLPTRTSRIESNHGAMPTPPSRLHASSWASVSAGQCRAPERGYTRDSYPAGTYPGSKKQPVPYLASYPGQAAATDSGVGFRPVSTQADSAASALAYSVSESELCSLSWVKVCTRCSAVPAPSRLARYADSCSTNAVGSSMAWTVSTGIDTAPVRSLSYDRSRTADGSGLNRSTPALSALSSCEPV